MANLAFNRISARGCRSAHGSQRSLPAVVFACVLGATSFASGSAQTVPSTCYAPTNVTPKAGQNVTIVGDRLYRGGNPWIPHGVQLIAFVLAPDEFSYVNNEPWFETAFNYYCSGPAAELNAIKTWGADTVRLQLSQRAADPQDPGGYYDANFVTAYVDAVKYARSIGLNVIVSIQSEMQPPTASGGGYYSGDLSDATTRVWNNLAPQLNGDDGIMYELFNEPDYASSYQPDSTAWTNYNAAANPLVTAIRATGATNILISDGLHQAQTLYNLVPLNDAKVVYSVHPYFHGHPDEESPAWDTRWGDVQTNDSIPIIAGEWATLASEALYSGFCDADTPQAAVNFLTYIRGKAIGLVAVTWDEPRAGWGGIVYDSSFDGTPTTFVGTSCVDGGIGSTDFSDSTNWGVGKTVQSWYINSAVPTSPQ
jgi:endoglucanase